MKRTMLCGDLKCFYASAEMSLISDLKFPDNGRHKIKIPWAMNQRLCYQSIKSKSNC